ncbi:hypothetical protein V5O48_009254 [Marasmius crinis-equi]|uniref:Uncharacterized protein n=1 Tax=Marasmius crinis-equi TaxID=585013 RepID=A0ABR3FBY6_9AGAR
MTAPPPYHIARDWDIDRLCDTANGVIAVSRDGTWTCRPSIFDHPGLRLKTGQDAKNWYVIFEVPQGELVPGLYRDFMRDVKLHLPDGSLSNTGIMCKGHPTLQKAEDHWVELCKARHHDEDHLRQRARLTAKLEREANEAKGRLVFNALVQLQPSLLGTGSSDVVSVSATPRVLNPISSPPSSPSRIRSPARISITTSRSTQWKLYVCFTGGVELCDDLIAAHRALKRALDAQGGVTGIFLAMSERQAKESFDSILANEASSAPNGT